MVRIWPFGKKQPEPVKTIKIRKPEVVEYERPTSDGQENLVSNRSHLKDKEFIDAMNFFGEDKKED
jgi:hypothetical protein